MSESGSGNPDSDSDSHYKKTRFCRECDKEYANRAGLRYHYKNTGCAGFECPKCGDNHFISKDGVKRHYGRQHEGSIWGVLTECANCDTEYRERKYRVENCSVTYCSKDCQKEHYNTDDIPITPLSGEDSPNWSGGLITVECDYCGKETEKRPDYVERCKYNHCSEECNWRHHSERYQGEDHPLWEGGYEYYGHNWANQAEKARERDDHICQGCGTHQDEFDSALNVHHITPLREFDDYEEANKLENLVSLCDGCHREWEGLYLKPVFIG
jgi:5-methylcytosine-specific restriction endonuclease McrA